MVKIYQKGIFKVVFFMVQKFLDYTDQTEIVKQYPTMVGSELKNYDEAVCKFFAVNRNQPDVSETFSLMIHAKSHTAAKYISNFYRLLFAPFILNVQFIIFKALYIK